MNIFPTHKCFDDALDYLVIVARNNPAELHTLTVVHGLGTATSGPYQGESYAHAWLEQDDRCIEAGILDSKRIWYMVDKREYYEARQITETTKYTVTEALRANRESGHFGPWVERYQA